MNILQFFISIFFIYLVYNIANQKKIYDVCDSQSPQDFNFR